jgi:hypothetical protein
MPLVNFRPAPGINKEVTDYTGEGKWTDGDNVRFFQGLPQKIKGWEKFISTTLVGVARDQHAWIALDGTRYDAIGTDRKLYVIQEGLAYDITPLNQTNTAATSVFTTTNGSSNVTVSISGHNAATGAFVTFDNVTLSNSSTSYTAATFEDKEFEILGIANANAFYIDAGSNEANAGITAQGTTDAAFQINPGPEFSTSAYGWGTDDWSAGAWGEPSTVSNVTLEARQWSLDNFGEDLIATVLNGGTFQWDTSAGVSTRATAVANAPTASRLSLVSTPDRHLVILGTENTIGTTSSQDDLLIRFSDQENITTYQPTAENTAGSLRIADGSRIVAAERSRGQILIWTDTSLHSMQFIGPPFTFGLRQLGQNCGIIGSHAGVDLNGVSYWMSQDSFYLFDGTVKKLPCTVEQFVFNNINQTAAENAFAGHNGEYNEILWFYPREGSSQINAIVAYNYLEGTWWTGTLARTSWIDREVYDNPIGTEYDATAIANNETIVGLTNGASTVYLHETGNDADGQAMTAYVKSGSVEIGEGNDILFVQKLIPDIQNQSGVLNMDLEFKYYPNNSNSVIKTTTFTDSTDFVSLRGRGREFTVNVVSNTTGTAWRLGTQRFDVQPDGRR